MIYKDMEIGDIHIEWERKAVRHIYLSVHAPDGRVHVSAPLFMPQSEIEAFVLRKWTWIQRQRAKIMALPKPIERHYIQGESCYLFGQRLTLEIVPIETGKTGITCEDGKIILTIKPDTNETQRGKMIDNYLRERLREYLTESMAHWQHVMGEENVTWSIRRMRSEWGSCTPRKRKLLFNTELVHVPKPCIDYIVVHELSHLRVPNHSDLFYARMEQFLPHWQTCRQRLKAAGNNYRFDLSEPKTPIANPC